MHINMTWIVVVLILALALIIFIMLRNRKDRKKFEESLGDSDIPPEQHDEDSM